MQRTKESPLDQGGQFTLTKPAEKRVFLWQKHLAENPIPWSIASLVLTTALTYLWIAGPNNPFKGHWHINSDHGSIVIIHKIGSCSQHASASDTISTNNHFTVRRIPDPQLLNQIFSQPNKFSPRTVETICYP